MLELLAIAVALVGTGLAAWQDWKTSFIDEKITFSMIGAGTLLALAQANVFSGAITYFDWGLLQLAFGGGAIIFAVGWLLYKTGKLGGGDVLLYTGIQMLLPVKPHALDGLLLPYLLPAERLFQWQLLFDTGLPFFLSVFLLSTMLALLGSSINYAWRLRKLKLKPDFLAAGFGMVAVIGFAYAMGVMGAGPKATAFYAVFLLPSAMLLAFRKQLMDEVIVQKVTITQIEDEDILVLEKMPQAIVAKYKLGPVLTKSEVEKLRLIAKREKITKFPVAKVLPRLGPYVFLAVLLGVLGLDLFTIVLAIS